MHLPLQFDVQGTKTFIPEVVPVLTEMLDGGHHDLNAAINLDTRFEHK